MVGRTAIKAEGSPWVGEHYNWKGREHSEDLIGDRGYSLVYDSSLLLQYTGGHWGTNIWTLQTLCKEANNC